MKENIFNQLAGAHQPLGFLDDWWTGEIKNNEPNKCAHLKWFLLDSPPTNIFPYVKFAIEQSQSGIVFSEYGFEN